MRPTERRGLFREQRRMDAAKDDPRTTFARETADLVAAQRIAGMNPDADDVARMDGRGIQHFQGFVRDEGIAILTRCRGREHVEPPWGNDTDAKRQVAWVDQMYVQVGGLLSA